MTAPEYMICLNCETPTYVFEWEDDKAVSIVCAACGNEEPTEFMSEMEMEDLSS